VKTFRIGGVHPAENKLSAGKAIETLALPKQAVFPLSQHIGAPATAIVKKGDVVKVGTKIAEAGGFVSAAIFSSVSGKVNKVDSVIDVAIVNRLFLLMWKVTNGKKASTAAANW
jgi:electron transport complex protein RnfC